MYHAAKKSLVHYIEGVTKIMSPSNLERENLWTNYTSMGQLTTANQQFAAPLNTPVSMLAATMPSS